jgi:sRNA-binding carbon storage regulator CsrA
VVVDTPEGPWRLVVLGAHGGRVTLGFDCPGEYRVLREELIEPVKEKKRA